MTKRLQQVLTQHEQAARRGDFESADALLRDALDEFPLDAEILLRWGVARADKAPTEAKTVLQRAAGLVPTDPWKQVRIGSALYNLGAIDESLACAKRAKRCMPEGFDFLPQLMNLTGKLAESKGNLMLARTALQAAFDLEPGFHGHAYDLAAFLARHDGAQVALDFLDRLPDDAATDDRARQLRARLERVDQ